MKVKFFSRKKALKYISLCDPKEIYVISIADPGVAQKTVLKNIPQKNKLELAFYDVYDPDFPHGPRKKHLKKLFKFAEKIERFENEIIVFCSKGYSRSPAIAYILWCWKLGYKKEKEALIKAFDNDRENMPNFLLVQIADSLLQRGGRMIHYLVRNFY
ncbi:MAG: hypothetical protein AAGA77_13160 [Bacteroidota bacterium]